MTLSQIIEAGNLTLWGTAFVLAWTAFLRLLDMAHAELVLRGRMKPRRHPMPPMAVTHPRNVALAALAAGVAVFIAFLAPVRVVSEIPHSLLLVRLILAQGVLLFFLMAVAAHPRWKLGWVTAWGLFCLLLKYLC